MNGTPGTVATATVRGLTGVRVMAISDGENAAAWMSATPVRSHTWHPADLVTDLLVLTAAEVTAADLTALTNAGGATLLALRDKLAAAQLPAPKPAEPLERGSVVLDVDGRQWVRASAPGVSRGWVQFETRQTGITYAEINAVRILE